MQFLPGDVFARHCLFSIPPFRTILLILSLFSICSLAIGGDSSEDHNHYRIADLQSRQYGPSIDEGRLELDDYMPEFLGADRSIIGRADDVVQLRNNTPGKDSIEAGDTKYYSFSKAELQSRQTSSTSISPSSSLFERKKEAIPPTPDESVADLQIGLQRRQTDAEELHVTLSICSQPNSSSSSSRNPPSPLQLYISTDPKNPRPSIANKNFSVPFSSGLGYQRLQASGDVFFAVAAPPTNKSFVGSYSYELTVSTGQPYTSYDGSESMVLVDSDHNSAFFCAGNNTNSTSYSYSIFVVDNTKPAISNLQKSVCGLRNHAQSSGNVINGSVDGNVDIGMMALGGAPPQRHFYLKELNRSSSYSGFLVMNNDSRTAAADGSGTLYKTVDFKTKSEDNCAVIFNLTFCSDVAYSVPSNPVTHSNTSELMQLYDDYAKNAYTNFNKSLQQIPCDTTSSAQYSLVGNCTWCAQAYKTWLCAVTIPRCEDFSNNATYLQPRAINHSFPNGTDPPPYNATDQGALERNASRNPMIDEQIKPGPYKEVLPCVDLCYDLVRSCPASLGFACPFQNHGLRHSYGQINETSLVPTCNYPGAAYGEMGGSTRLSRTSWIMIAALLIGLLH